MPNHVRNVVVIHADPAAHTKGGRLEFSAIIPPPFGVLMRGSLASWEEKRFTTWHEWCSDNWGTKWGPYSCAPVKADGGVWRFTFDTAWNPPLPITLALSQIYHCRVEHEWACEGECTFGRIVYDDGMIVEVDADGSYTMHRVPGREIPCDNGRASTWREVVERIAPDMIAEDDGADE